MLNKNLFYSFDSVQVQLDIILSIILSSLSLEKLSCYMHIILSSSISILFFTPLIVYPDRCVVDMGTSVVLLKFGESVKLDSLPCTQIFCIGDGWGMLETYVLKNNQNIYYINIYLNCLIPTLCQLRFHASRSQLSLHKFQGLGGGLPRLLQA